MGSRINPRPGDPNYPEPSDPETTAKMRANRRRDTKPEAEVRSILHRRGYRFRKDHLLKVGDVRTHPDIVFTRQQLAVYIDGCFWHQCPEHGTMPVSNVDYWKPKLARNVERDREVTEALEAAGWTVLRIWEHIDPAEAADRVQGALEGAGQ